jgi:aryl-alcohol dehydrogenase-like predicted oxidoreductase
MRKIILGRTNTTVSAISLGTWAFGGENKIGKKSVGLANQSDRDSRSVLIKAWEKNINHWDTADVYGEGHSERIIGSMWEDIPRDSIFLATKVGWDMGPFSHWYHPKHMKKKIEESLTNLKTDYIDLLYLHHCNFGKQDEYFDDAVEVLKSFQSQGKIRFTGLSDWSNERIVKYLDACNPDVIQPYRNIMDNTYEESGLKNIVNKNNLGVCFFSPLKHGLLTGKYKTTAVFKDGDHRSGIKDFQNKNKIKKIMLNCEKLEKKFLHHENPIMHGIVNALFFDSPTGCVLLGQRNIKQVETASSLGEILSEEDTSWVKSLYKV